MPMPFYAGQYKLGQYLCVSAPSLNLQWSKNKRCYQQKPPWTNLQKQFATQVSAVVEVWPGNPFEKVRYDIIYVYYTCSKKLESQHMLESPDMLTLRLEDIMDQESVECLTVIRSRGKQQYVWTKGWGDKPYMALTAPITKVVLFNEQAKRTKISRKKLSLCCEVESSLLQGFM